MTSQTRKQTIVRHILPDVSRSIGNQTMKFGQLIEYNVIILFLKHHTENEAGTLLSDLFLFLK